MEKVQETPTQTKEEQIMEALRSVIDPEIGLNIVELGLVRKLELSDDKLHVTAIMTTPFCPYAPQLLEQMRITAHVASGLPTTIEMGLETWHPGLMEEGIADSWGLF